MLNVTVLRQSLLQETSARGFASFKDEETNSRNVSTGEKKEQDQLREETEPGPDYGAPRQDPALMSWHVSHSDFLHVIPQGLRRLPVGLHNRFCHDAGEFPILIGC